MEQNTKSKKWVWILVVVLILLMGVFTLWYFKPDASQTNTNTNQQNTTTNTTDTTTETTTFSVKGTAKLLLSGGYADPTIAKTATGYRMYVNKFGNGPSGYLTYTSTDGVTWTKESSSFVVSGAATGRAVVLPTGVRFYYPGAQPINPSDPPANLFSAFSTDGLNFKKDSGTRLEPKTGYYIEGPTVFQLSDKSWRMYFNENLTSSGNERRGEIWGASSPDGLTWTRDATVTIEAETSSNNPSFLPQALHPFVLKKPAGGYLMFYNANSEVYAAESSDGKTWTKLGKIGIHGADVDGYFEDANTIRLFYGDFSEATSGVVYTVQVEVD